MPDDKAYATWLSNLADHMADDGYSRDDVRMVKACADRLKAVADEIAIFPHPSGLDGTERLCQAVYGRPSQARDYLGGSEARMLHDAADLIGLLRERIEDRRQAKEVKS